MGQQDWSRWLDDVPDGQAPGPEPAQAPEPDLDAELAPAPEAGRPVLVVGGCGGAGTTTTVLGLAAELAVTGVPTAAVDATAAGGDLALRGADSRLQPISLQGWLYGTGSDDPAPLAESMSLASTGAGILWRDASPLRRRASYLNVGRVVSAAGYTPVYDGGAPITARQLLPLLEDPDVALVLAIPARADAVNRLRVTLEWLDDELGAREDGPGTGIVAETTIVVSHQTGYSEPEVAEHLRDNLAGWVRDVLEIPYDPLLARGELITHGDLAADTRKAYAHLLDTCAYADAGGAA